ncbi:MAG: hypothetical protein IPN15_00250 [Saprospiraceae bacterium]|nr:hypothetical protein [Candidatus Vicinibacter affinis]MBK7696786.1 hypothetical protein [Candidatus Vicinibacter affinis]MBK8640684.1 hypothetical protein [Candidatus Vicinibacter affinis]
MKKITISLEDLIKKGEERLFILLWVFCMPFSFLSSQNLVWAKAFGSEGNEKGHGMVVDKFGNVYTIGFFTGTVCMSSK